jgi:serine/threonine protein kinase
LQKGAKIFLYSAHYNGKPVVVKTVKPKLSVREAIVELEREVKIHDNIVELVGAGLTPDGQRFITLEKLDGETLSHLLMDGQKPQLRLFNRKVNKKLFYLDVLKHSRSLACALDYCHARIVPGSMILHRDLKPENIAFTSDGRLKLLDFGLAKRVDNASPDTDDEYQMSGNTGSYRYMSPEVG